MSKQVNVLLVSDLDGEPAEKTTRFGLDGHSYEIDLTPGQDAELRSSLAPYIDVARRANGSKAPARAARAPRAPRGARTPRPPSPTAINFVAANTAEEPAHVGGVRAWAQSPAGARAIAAAGLPAVRDRGRIAAQVTALYEASK